MKILQDRAPGCEGREACEQLVKEMAHSVRLFLQ
jgi:hypothetical protein